MVQVYVLRSLSSGRFYIGITENIERRIVEHNKGKSKFTKGHLPWELIYTEDFENFISARKREKYFKTAARKRWLRSIDIFSFFNLSIPCPSTLVRRGSLLMDTKPLRVNL